MAPQLDGKRIAFLVANEGVEQVELTEPWKAVEKAGGEPVLIAPEEGDVQAFNHLDKSSTFPVDETLEEARADELRRRRASRRRRQPGRVAHRAASAAVPEGHLLRRQAGRRDLPRSVDAGRGRPRPRPADHQLALVCRPTSATPAATGSTRRCVVDEGLVSIAASRTTCRRSARRSSRSSPRASTRSHTRAPRRETPPDVTRQGPSGQSSDGPWNFHVSSPRRGRVTHLSEMVLSGGHHAGFPAVNWRGCQGATARPGANPHRGWSVATPMRSERLPLESP